MRILFIYTKIDNTLRDRVKRLREHNATVDTLSLLEYKLDENGSEVKFDINSKLEFLEDKGKLKIANRIKKRKKLLDQLKSYDLIDIYKCENSALPIKKKIEELCCCFFVTVNDENISFLKRAIFSPLYSDADILIFSSKSQLNSFKFGDKDRYRYLAKPISLFKNIDNTSLESVKKAYQAMGLDQNKDIVYCDLSSSIDRQLKLIEEISSINRDFLLKKTFIFWLSSHDLHDRDAIKDTLLEKNFDYLLIETMMTQKQQALIYKLCNTSIILSDKSDSLPISLYSKHKIYLYEKPDIDAIFNEEDFYMQDFEEFIDQNSENKIENDLLEKNHKKAKEIFDPKSSVENYISIIKELQ